MVSRIPAATDASPAGAGTHDRRVFGDRGAERQSGKLVNLGDFVQRFFHGRVTQ